MKAFQGSSVDERADSPFFLMVVILITAALFSPILGFGFNLATDDVFFVLQNPLVKDASLNGLLAVATSPGAMYGEIQPIPYLSFWINHAVFGMRAWGYYAVQILLHLVNVVLVFLLVRSVFKNELIALVTALIFAIHPLQVDAVAMVNQRKTLLAALFALLSLLAYEKWSESGSRYTYTASVILFLLALLSKSSAAVVPLLMALMSLFRLQGRPFLAQLRPIVPFFLLALVFSGVTVLTESSAEQVHPLKFGTVMSQIQLILLIYADYFLSFLWPLNLSPAYVYRLPDLHSFKMAAVVLCCAGLLVVLAVAVRKQAWRLVWGIGWFVVCLLPTSQVIPTTNLRQDHYLYMALVGLASIVGMGMKSAVGRRPARKFYLPVILSITALLGPITFAHLEHYSNGLKYCERYERTQGWMPAMESIRGRVLLLIGEYRAAEQSYRRTIDSFEEPLKSRERYQLAQVYLRMGRTAEARQQLELMSDASPLKSDAEQMMKGTLDCQ